MQMHLGSKILEAVSEGKLVQRAFEELALCRQLKGRGMSSSPIRLIAHGVGCGFLFIYPRVRVAGTCGLGVRGSSIRPGSFTSHCLFKHCFYPFFSLHGLQTTLHLPIVFFLSLIMSFLLLSSSSLILCFSWV